MTFTLLAITLVTASALCWSLYDLLRKLLVRTIPPLPLLLPLVAAQVPLFAVWVGFEGEVSVASGYALPALGSVLLNIAANVAMIVAFSLAPLSATIPLLSLTPVFTALLAWPILGELPGPVEFVGIVLVVVGAFLLNVRRGESVGVRSALASRDHRRGSLLMILVALCWSLAMPLDKVAMQTSSAPFHGLVLSVGVALGVLVLMIQRGELSTITRTGLRPLLFILAVVASTLALGLQLLSFELVFVSLVETVKRGIGNVLALVFGRLLLDEEITLFKVLAVALMAVGVGMILV